MRKDYGKRLPRLFRRSEHRLAACAHSGLPVCCKNPSRLNGRGKLRTEVPVNVGRNYNGPKVAKFLVGEVPTCTNRVTTERLSRRGSRRNCNCGEDAACPQ